MDTDEQMPVEINIRSNPSHTVFTLTIATREPIEESDVVDLLKAYINSVESGALEMDFFYDLIEEH